MPDIGWAETETEYYRQLHAAAEHLLPA